MLTNANGPQDENLRKLLSDMSEEDVAKALEQIKKSGIDLHKLDAMKIPDNPLFASETPKQSSDSAMLSSSTPKGIDQFSSGSPRHSSDSAMLTQSHNTTPSRIGGGGGGGGGGCFVATAVYGDACSTQVRFLRAFRDEFLLPRLLGRAFVRFYYRVGPIVAIPVAKIPLLKKVTRKSLGGLIALIERHTHLRIKDFDAKR